MQSAGTLTPLAVEPSAFGALDGAELTPFVMPARVASSVKR